MHHTEIEVDIDVEDEVEEDLDEGRGPVVCHKCEQPGHYATDMSTPTSEMYVLSCNKS
jgi:hypothetical protein